MLPGRLVGAGLAAVALAATLAGPAQADNLPETVAATGSPSGVTALCPQGLHPADNVTITNGDGTPLGPNQRWTWRDTDGQPGVIAWIGPYLNSPPPPPSITLTISCVC
ncbi:hypothetical protein [Streptacidiphilus jiangxiensis]|uniref:Ig-like domain-containing protein n=1 Tax=Streptacidiphilus jiangxiensis TaxID=235985 RepID=A0A1H7T0Y7_STRJI|nr:hypothetical protein [Streptacidiphilus jiangxiensis]SEL78493.1 hypothetical protein SAMN05414137_11315 [Streptacidiphilus jiangxiensis]